MLLSSSLRLGIDVLEKEISLFLDQGSDSWNWCFGLQTPRLLVIMLWIVGGFVNAFGFSSVTGCGTELCMSSFLLGYFSSAFIQCCSSMIDMGNLSVELSFWHLDVRSVE